MAEITLFGEWHCSKKDKNKLKSYDLSKIDAFFSEGRDNTCDIVKISKGKDIFESINCLSFMIGALIWSFTILKFYKSYGDHIKKSSKKYEFEIHSEIDIPFTELCKVTKKLFFRYMEYGLEPKELIEKLINKEKLKMLKNER